MNDNNKEENFQFFVNIWPIYKECISFNTKNKQYTEDRKNHRAALLFEFESTLDALGEKQYNHVIFLSEEE